MTSISNRINVDGVISELSTIMQTKKMKGIVKPFELSLIEYINKFCKEDNEINSRFKLMIIGRLIKKYEIDDDKLKIYINALYEDELYSPSTCIYSLIYLIRKMKLNILIYSYILITNYDNTITNNPLQKTINTMIFNGDNPKIAKYLFDEEKITNNNIFLDLTNINFIRKCNFQENVNSDNIPSFKFGLKDANKSTKIDDNLIITLIEILLLLSKFDSTTDDKIDKIYPILYLLIKEFYINDEEIVTIFNKLINNEGGCAPKTILKLKKLSPPSAIVASPSAIVASSSSAIINPLPAPDPPPALPGATPPALPGPPTDPATAAAKGGYNKNMNEFEIFKANFKQNIKKVYAKNAREGAKLIAMKFLKGNKKSIKFTLIGKKEKIYNYQAYIDEQGKIKIKNQ